MPQIINEDIPRKSFFHLAPRMAKWEAAAAITRLKRPSKKRNENRQGTSLAQKRRRRRLNLTKWLQPALLGWQDACLGFPQSRQFLAREGGEEGGGRRAAASSSPSVPFRPSFLTYFTQIILPSFSLAVFIAFGTLPLRVVLTRIRGPRIRDSLGILQ